MLNTHEADNSNISTPDVESAALKSDDLTVQKPHLLPSLQQIRTTELLSIWWNSRSEKTNRAYRQDIELFRAWLQKFEGLPVETVDQAAQIMLSAGQGTANRLAQGFQNHLRDSGKAPTTINRTLSALKSMVKQANLLGMVPWTLTVTRMKAESYRDTKGPGLHNYRKMLGACKDRKDVKGIRDYAILCTLYSLALRRSELVNTEMEHLDLNEGTLSVLGKGKTQRIKLTLPEPTKKALAQWIAVRGTYEGPLFYGIDKGGGLKGALTGNGLYDLIKTLGKKVGIITRVHGIRHTAITQAVRAASAASLDLSKVMQFSRHSSLNVLEIYLDNDRNYQGQISSLVAVGMES
ncbi:MAG: tyrosine-type recombinase/integrase [Desulfomonilaceae bacterium]